MTVKKGTESCCAMVRRIGRFITSSLNPILPFLIGVCIGYFGYVQLFNESQSRGLLQPGKALKFLSSLHVKGANGGGKEKEETNWGHIRILCMVMTTPSHHRRRAISIRKTWGERCSDIYFMTYQEDKMLGNTVVLKSIDRSFNSWRKTMETWKYVHEKHIDNFDWFLKVEDDVYVILENLRYMLRHENTADPVYFGHLLRDGEFKYLSGYPGYVMSREALRRFVKVINDGNMLGPCSSLSFNSEDVLLAKCLEHAQVKPMDTRDPHGRLRFLPLPLQYHFGVTRYRRNKIREMISSSDKKFELGEKCCSDIAIAFHEMDGKRMLTMEYMVYHLEPHGLPKTGRITSGSLVNITS